MREKRPDNLGTSAQTDAVKSTWLYYRPKQQLSRGVVAGFLSHYFVKSIQERFWWKRLKKEKLRYQFSDKQIRWEIMYLNSK